MKRWPRNRVVPTDGPTRPCQCCGRTSLWHVPSYRASGADISWFVCEFTLFADFSADWPKSPCSVGDAFVLDAIVGFTALSQWCVSIRYRRLWSDRNEKSKQYAFFFGPRRFHLFPVPLSVSSCAFAFRFSGPSFDNCGTMISSTTGAFFDGWFGSRLWLSRIIHATELVRFGFHRKSKESRHPLLPCLLPKKHHTSTTT